MKANKHVHGIVTPGDPRPNRIVIHRRGNCYTAQFTEGPKADEVKRIFEQDELPLPYTALAGPHEVYHWIYALNAHDSIITLDDALQCESEAHNG